LTGAAEKNKAMGSLTIAKDGHVLYARVIGYQRRLDAFLSTAGRVIRGDPRSDDRG